jgi:hypothetical protein
MTCVRCAKSKETKNDRLPNGWKRMGTEIICGTCWGNAYILRAVTFPIAGPIGIEWKELRERLAACWQQSTGMANWAITELAKADVIRAENDKKLGPMPYTYLYPGARRRFPAMTPSSVVSLLHAVEGRYRKARLEVIWWASASLPRYKYPVPYPIHVQNWSARWLSEKERVPIIDMRLGESRIALRLAGGPGVYRQRAAFASLVEGDAIGCEASIYRQRGASNDNRIGVTEREPGGKARIHYRVMCKLVMWLPRKQADKGEATMEVKTQKDRFVVATIDGREPWVLNADHILRWVKQHRRRLDRIAEDTKYEKRWPKKARAQIADGREAFVQKHHNRIDTFIHQASAALIGYAQRNGVARLRYDDSERLTSEFPWHALKEKIVYKCDGAGIAFAEEAASGEVMDKKADPLADTEGL